jgi:hypothetical protein
MPINFQLLAKLSTVDVYTHVTSLGTLLNGGAEILLQLLITVFCIQFEMKTVTNIFGLFDFWD